MKKNNNHMKKLSLVLLCAIVLSGFSLAQQKPAMEFKKTEHNFGIIKEEIGAVTTQFEFTNTGNSPLLVQPAPRSSDLISYCSLSTYALDITHESTLPLYSTGGLYHTSISLCQPYAGLSAPAAVPMSVRIF